MLAQQQPDATLMDMSRSEMIRVVRTGYLMLSRISPHRTEHGLYRLLRYCRFTSATALDHSAAVYGSTGR